MNTFFEKITGGANEQEPELASHATLTHRDTKHFGRKTDSDTKHLKIEAEGKEAAEETPDKEDEGELTVDIYDKGDTIVIQSTVAGVKPEDLDVSIMSDSVTIRGRREMSEEVKEKDYYYKELFWGSFSRSVILPEEIDDEKAEANLKHGLLTIRLPKKQKDRVQKLKVKVT